MTMQFEIIKASLEAILNAAAPGGGFRVVGYQQQASAAEKFLGVDRRVMVVYTTGDFPKDKAGMTGPTCHDIRFNLELAVSAKAKADLSVLNNPGSTGPQRVAALAAIEAAGKIADDAMDDFIGIVYQILMDSAHLEIGTGGPPYTVFNRWAEDAQKGEPLPMGELLVLAATIGFSCSTNEEITGATGIPVVQPGYDQSLDHQDGDIQKTGVSAG